MKKMKIEARKEMFEEPIANVTMFDSVDVITASGDELPYDEF